MSWLSSKGTGEAGESAAPCVPKLQTIYDLQPSEEHVGERNE